MSDINPSPGYSIKLEVTLDDYVGPVSSTTFTVFVTDPCPGTTLQNTGVADMFDYARDGTTTSQTIQLKDSVSLANDPGGEGYLTCAP